jgi:hypothetical protein
VTDDGMPRRLPNAARAIVEERRIRDYLLDLDHVTGGPKARFFIAHGFASNAWNLLRASLTIQGRTNRITRSVETAWGTRHTVECNCPTPDGRNPCIRTVWQMEDDAPRLLTAIPL